MQWDNLEKFRLKIDGSSLLVAPDAANLDKKTLCTVHYEATIGGVPIIRCRPWIGNDQECHVKADSGRVAFTLPPTGMYRRTRTDVLRLVRNPVRAFKLGLTNGNSSVFSRDGRQRPFGDGFGTQGFQDMVENNYPTFKEALDEMLLDVDVKCIPIARHTAITRSQLGVIAMVSNETAVCWFHRGSIVPCQGIPLSMVSLMAKQPLPEIERMVVNV